MIYIYTQKNNKLTTLEDSSIDEPALVYIDTNNTPHLYRFDEPSLLDRRIVSFTMKEDELMVQEPYGDEINRTFIHRSLLVMGNEFAVLSDGSRGGGLFYMKWIDDKAETMVPLTNDDNKKLTLLDSVDDVYVLREVRNKERPMMSTEKLWVKINILTKRMVIAPSPLPNPPYFTQDGTYTFKYAGSKYRLFKLRYDFNKNKAIRHRLFTVEYPKPTKIKSELIVGKSILVLTKDSRKQATLHVINKDPHTHTLSL